jgi:hypothetical protein
MSAEFMHGGNPVEYEEDRAGSRTLRTCRVPRFPKPGRDRPKEADSARRPQSPEPSSPPAQPQLNATVLDGQQVGEQTFSVNLPLTDRAKGKVDPASSSRRPLNQGPYLGSTPPRYTPPRYRVGQEAPGRLPNGRQAIHALLRLCLLVRT